MGRRAAAMKVEPEVRISKEKPQMEQIWTELRDVNGV